MPDKSCWTSFGFGDTIGTTYELDGSCNGTAGLVSKVPISTNLSLLVTPDLVNVTCSGKFCPIVFKGKAGGWDPEMGCV